MPVVLVVTDRTWTSVSATELNDHILRDGIFEGPTFITRDELGVPPDETFLYKNMSCHLVRDQTYQTSLKAATVLSRFVSHGYRIVSQAGSGVGTSGKARYSADVAVTDYRWVWTLVRDDMAPPPYLSSINHPSSLQSSSGYSVLVTAPKAMQSNLEKAASSMKPLINSAHGSQTITHHQNNESNRQSSQERNNQANQN